MPSVGFYFGVYSYCKRTIGPMFRKCLGSEREDGKKPLCSDNSLQTFSIMMSAAIGEFLMPIERDVRFLFYMLLMRNYHFYFTGNTLASFSRVPYEVVKQSLQTGQYMSTIEALSSMWKNGGIRSFFPLGGISIQMVSFQLVDT